MQKVNNIYIKFIDEEITIETKIYLENWLIFVQYFIVYKDNILL